MNTSRLEKGPLRIDRTAQWRQRDQERQEFPCPPHNWHGDHHYFDTCDFCGRQAAQGFRKYNSTDLANARPQLPHCSFCGVIYVTPHSVVSHDCPRFRTGDYQVAYAKRQEHASGVELLYLGGAIVIVGFLAVYGLVLYGTVHPLLAHVVAFLQQVEESL